MAMHDNGEPIARTLMREIKRRTGNGQPARHGNGEGMGSGNTGSWDLFGDIGAITRWLDRSNAHMNPDLDESMRIMKIGEEFGEVVAAYIGFTGQNPRKGQTHGRADVLAELADVAVTALCAMHRFTQDETLTRAVLASKVASVMDRSGIRDTGPQPALIPATEVPGGPSGTLLNPFA